MALQNKKIIYDLLFRTSAETLLEIARDPQALGRGHRILQCPTHLEPASPKSSSCPLRVARRWPVAVTAAGSPLAVPSFFPSRCSAVSFAVSSSRLEARLQPRPLRFHGNLKRSSTRIFASWLRQLFRNNWVVYSSAPSAVRSMFSAISGLIPTGSPYPITGWLPRPRDKITFRWRDSAHRNQKRLMTMPVEEFLRRFLLHVLPRGFVRIRNFGFLANRHRATLLPLCFRFSQSSGRKTSANRIGLLPIVRSLPHSGLARFAVGLCTSVERLSAAQTSSSFARHRVLRLCAA